MRQPTQITDRYSADWLAGYRAALADLDAVVDGLGDGPAMPFVLARLKAQLIQRQADRKAA